ncbi:hypothetical protein P3G55_16930 [Leptospira sp. 96542]|nr:hypothetical protein [Leptospira sp. 96542]
MVNFFHTKREITEVYNEASLTNGTIIFISFSTAYIHPIFLLPILSTPYLQYKYKEKSDKILSEWKTNDCGIKETLPEPGQKEAVNNE